MNNKVRQLEIIKPSPNESAIRVAKDLLRRCESGEVTDFTYVVFGRDKTYTTGGTSFLNMKEKIGVLFTCLVDMTNLTESE